MKCPKCGSDMETVVYGTVETDRCSECKGFWLDANETKTLIEMHGAEIVDSGDRAIGKLMNEKHDIVCPRCGVLMIHLADPLMPDVVYEQCPACSGMFLDAGELSSLKEESFINFVKTFKDN
ncbi:MAG: zf-TFIIB domain-containing protein [Spirochaetes bacterium]|jgi:Zn-finger nucleic acid-binding protein|nr:zf-TFIIB domain-containing protein [Spirochaetota bacterium]